MTTLDQVLDFANQVKSDYFELSINEEHNKRFSTIIPLDHIQKNLTILLAYNGHVHFSTTALYEPRIQFILYIRNNKDKTKNIYDREDIWAGINLEVETINILKELNDMLLAYGKPLKNRMEITISDFRDNAVTTMIIYPDNIKVKLVDFEYDYSRAEEMDIALPTLNKVMDELKPLTQINLSIKESEYNAH